MVANHDCSGEMGALGLSSAVGAFRNGFERIEQSELPDAIKLTSRYVRRILRWAMLTVLAIRRAFDPQSVRRTVLFPIRNVVGRNQPITVYAGGESFFINPRGAVAREVWSCGHFERHELGFVLSVLKAGATFVDVGANVGLFSLPAAKKVGSGKVFAFEPCGWTYEQLLENARINRASNLQPVRLALGDCPGEAILQVNSAGRDGLNTLGRPTHEHSKVVKTERVPVARLDDFLKQRSVTSVDVVKIDVEGAELFVLRGATGVLSRPDAPVILYEGGFLSRGFDYHPVEQMWLLQKHGYSLFVIDSASGKISVPANSKAYDAMVIAAKPSHPANIAIRERMS
jgi:FkbM family methyltransferase